MPWQMSGTLGGLDIFMTSPSPFQLFWHRRLIEAVVLKCIGSWENGPLIAAIQQGIVGFWW